MHVIVVIEHVQIKKIRKGKMRKILEVYLGEGNLHRRAEGPSGVGSLVLKLGFSFGDNFTLLLEHLGMSGNILGCHIQGILLESSGYRPGRLQNILRCTGYPRPQTTL